MPITKSDVEKLEPNSITWDHGRGSVPNFGVRRQTKFPTFFLKYSVRGRQKWFTIGRWGAPWTVEQARNEARRLLGIIIVGGDPAEARDVADPISVAELCDRYMVAAEAGAILTRFNRPKKKSTLEIDKGRISRHIKPLIGRKVVTEIDSRAIRRLIEDITVGKTARTVKTKARGKAIVKGGMGTAARVADLLSGIMTWAVEEGMIAHNPVHKVRRYRGEPKQRFLSPEELLRVGRILLAEITPAGKALHRHAVNIIKLLCLTGCRRGEITSLRWSEVDLDLKCLRLEDTKVGRSLRPIGEAAMHILRAQDRVAGNPYVFAGARGGSAYQGLGKQFPMIFQAAQIENATPHTLRHTFASAASELGYSDGTIAGLLGHKGRGVTSRYVHRPDQALASAADAVCSEVATQLSGSKADEGRTRSKAVKVAKRSSKKSKTPA